VRLGIAAATAAPLAEDVRRALICNEWAAGLLRLRRAGWDAEATARGVRGRRGPGLVRTKAPRP
jgi:hypothetical protein